MSISAPLAVTMMIGTWLRLRSWRHTSMPDTFGSITSSSTRSGWTASNRSSAWAPSRATCTRKPSRRSPTVRASTKDSSSSTTSTVVSVTLTAASARSARSTCLLRPVTRAMRAGADRDAQRERRARRPPGTRPTRCRRGWWPRGARWRGRGRCRRSRGCGPGRPGRSARRCGRGRAPGCRCRGRATTMSTHVPSVRAETSTGEPGSEYFTPFSTQVGHRRHELAPITDDVEPARRLGTMSTRDLALLGQVPDPLDRLGRDQADADHLAVGRLAELDARQLEQVLDGAAHAMGLAHHLLGQPASRPRARPRRSASRPAGPGRRPASSARG